MLQNIQLIILILSYLTLIGQIILVVLLLLFVLNLIIKNQAIDNFLNLLGRRGIAFSFIVALTATLGSLYFSEIAQFIPCKLCWFQRIFMYPQVFILGLAMILKDRRVWRYSIFMSALGASISAYHYFTQLFPPSVSFCSLDSAEPCSQKIFFTFGYITIPVMALTASLSIIFFSFFAYRLDRK